MVVELEATVVVAGVAAALVEVAPEGLHPPAVLMSLQALEAQLRHMMWIDTLHGTAVDQGKCTCCIKDCA